MADIACGIYCRMSVAADGDTVKVDHQEKLCREAAARLGWIVARVYQDNNRSAWKKNRKRPGWDAMLADVEAGKISAIMVYHGDRLIRQPDDLGVLLKLADGKGIRLASPTGERDLGSGDDRFVLYIEAAMAMRESDNTSRRRKAQYERWRREGKVRPGGTGGRAFGFTTRNEVDPAEADLIREAARRVLGGESLIRISADLAARGVTGPTGKPMSRTTLRRSLGRPRLAGLMPDGVSKAAWEPILERTEWEAVVAVLDTRVQAYTWNTTNGRRYLLSGIARCGECDSGLQLRSESKGGGAKDGYGCITPGCRKVQRNVILLDAYVIGWVVRRLNVSPAGRAPQLPGLAAEFRSLTEARAETAAAVADPSQRHVDLLLARLDTIDERLAVLRDMSGESARDRLIRDHAGMTREDFDAAPLSVRRALVAACVSVTVLPASGRGPGFRPEDVRVTPV